MRVNQTRRQDRFRPVEPLLRLKPSVDFALTTHSDNAIAAHRYRAIFDHSMPRVFGNDISAAPDPVRRLRRQGPDE
jgi:hypothetical protein